MRASELDFGREIAPFLDACPRPGLAGHVVHRAARQPVVGITSGLSGRGVKKAIDSRGDERPLSEGMNEMLLPRYAIFIVDWGSILNCRAAYLSEDAKQHGYSLSLALRYVRFLHGIALRSQAVKPHEIAWRLRFNDVAGWSRFTVRLVGQSPSNLPSERLSYWTKRAGVEVFSATWREYERCQ